MRINEKILQISRNTGMDVNKILKVAFALYVAKDYPNLLQEYFQSDELTQDEVEHIYRIELFNFDGEYSLKFPLFVEEREHGDFDTWWKMKKNYGLTTDGYRGNETTFKPLARTVEVVEAFRNVVDGLDYDKTWKVIQAYYRDKQYVSKLDKYLNTAFLDDYEVFKEDSPIHIMQ